MTVVTIKGRCPLCHKSSTVEITDDPRDQKGYFQYLCGEPVQTAFPHWSTDQRELLLSGIHPDCWASEFEWLGQDTDG